LTDYAGTVTQKLLYYPWGQTWQSAGTVKDNRFASMEQRDAETGNDPTLFRLYNPRLYRWLSPDPLAGNILNPQSLNRYAYVLNNPCSLIDPVGLENCNFQVQLVNDAGFSNDQLQTMMEQMNNLLGATKSPSGDTVGIIFGGVPDTTLTLTTPGWFMNTFRGGTMGAESLFLSPRVYVNNLPNQANYSAKGTARIAAAAGLHELAHEWVSPFHSSYDPNDPSSINTLMFPSLPLDMRTNALLNPDSPAWRLSPGQISTLFKNCREKGVRGGRGGGGGGGWAGGPGVGVYAIPVGGWTAEGTSTIIGWVVYNWGGHYYPPRRK
jgi:RHS repeat-associated protein